MATNKVKPDPNALERQQRRQRSTARSRRVRAYVAVAAVVVAIAVGAVAVSRIGAPTNAPGGSSTSPVGSTSFTSTLPAGAEVTTPTVFGLQGGTSIVGGLPPDAYSLSVAADGRTIAFIASDDRGYDHLGIMAMGGQPRIIPTPNDLILGTTNGIGTAAISPDGSVVAFEAYNDATTDIYVVGADGSGLTRLTTDPATDQFPQWSPDGSTIVYDNAGAHEDANDPQFSRSTEIFTVPADGSAAPTELTRNAVEDAAPSFSPDGSRIAFMHGGDNEIWTMAADGSDPRPVGTAGGFTPRWSPDGALIAFTTFSSTYRPIVAMATSLAQRPLVVTTVVDVATGKITTLRQAAMASDYNVPQWTDAEHLLILRVPAKL